MSRLSNEPGTVDLVETLHTRALDKLSKGLASEAESICLRALELSPHNVGVLNVLGQSFLAQRKPSEAASAFGKAVELQPELANLHFNVALAFQAEGRLADAIGEIKQAISLDPSVPALHSKLGQLLCAVEQNDEAVTVLRHALSLDPSSVPTKINLSQALIESGRVSEAEQTAKSILTKNPRDPIAQRLMGRIHQLNGRFEEASACFQSAIALQPTQAAAYFALAYSKKVSRSESHLIERMSRLLLLPQLPESDSGLLRYALGKAYDDLGEYDSAIAHFEMANEIALRSRTASGRPYDPAFASARVDMLIERFGVEEFEKPLPEASISERPVFIVGMIRSGTTLVEQILSGHPEIATAGELPFWLREEPRVMESLFGPQDSSTQSIESWTTQYDAVLNGVSSEPSRVTDKMPLNYWALGMIHRLYPNARIIHCRRDPIDTCLSVYLTPYRGGPEFGHDRTNIAHAYREYRRLMDHWRSVIAPSQLLEVDYEDLVSDRESGTRKMIEFLGLPWSEECLQTSPSARLVSTPSQWQVRQPIYRSSVGRWRNYEHHLGELKTAVT